MDLIQQMNWRYATKQFNSAGIIDLEKYEKIKEVLRLSPSSFGLQPWKFLLVRDQNTKELLKPASWNQAQITECDVLVVLCYRKNLDEKYIDRFVKSISEIRKIDVSSLDSYKAMMMDALVNNGTAEGIKEWAEKQTHIALGNLMTACAVLGVDTCAIGGFVPAEYDRILNLNETEYRSSVVCALGYRSAEDKYGKLAKVRFFESDIIQEI